MKAKRVTIEVLEVGARNMFDEMSERSGGLERAKKVRGNGRFNSYELRTLF